ncbi:ABC transporter substrate-binding protein [Streptomyces sp. GTA36]
MVYRTVLAVAAAVALLATTGCGGSEAKQSKTNGIKGLLSAGKFKVCSDVEFPPLEFFENGTSGKPVGFDVELAEAVAKEVGLEAEVRNVAFDGLLPALDAKRCDVVWSGLYVSPERTKTRHAVPYLRIGDGVLVPAGNPEKIQTPEDLSGKTVAVAAGTTAEKALKGLNEQFNKNGTTPMKITAYSKFTEEVAAVKSGKADAMVEVDVSVGYIAKQQEGELESLSDVFQPKNELGAYVRKGSPLASEIKDALALLSKAGTTQKLAEKYGLESSRIVAE